MLASILTLFQHYFINLTFYYEKAARCIAYNYFELIFTYFFDVLVMGNHFKLIEIFGAVLIFFSYIYLFYAKSKGIID